MPGCHFIASQVTDAQLQMSGAVPGSRYSFSTSRGPTAALTAGPSMGGGTGGAYSTAVTPAPRLLGASSATGGGPSSTPYAAGGGAAAGAYGAPSMTTTSRYASAMSSVGGGAFGGLSNYSSSYGGTSAIPTTSRTAGAPPQQQQQSAFKAFTPSAGLTAGGYAVRSTYDSVADALNAGQDEGATTAAGAGGASGLGFMGRMSAGSMAGGSGLVTGGTTTPHRPSSGVGGTARF